MGPLPQYWSFKWVVVKICSKWIWQIIGIESSKETFQQSRSRIRNKMAQDVPQVAEKSSQRQYTCPQDFHLYILTQGSWTGQGVSKSLVLVYKWQSLENLSDIFRSDRISSLYIVSNNVQPICRLIFILLLWGAFEILWWWWCYVFLLCWI